MTTPVPCFQLTLTFCHDTMNLRNWSFKKLTRAKARWKRIKYFQIILPDDSTGFSQGPSRGADIPFSSINPVSASGRPEDQMAPKTVSWGLENKTRLSKQTGTLVWHSAQIKKYKPNRGFSLVCNKKVQDWVCLGGAMTKYTVLLRYSHFLGWLKEISYI